MRLLLQWLLTSMVLILVAAIMPGISVENFGTALIAAFVLGAVNTLLRPLILLLTLPINLLTLGLFAFIVNALMFALAAWIVPGFEISNFLSALVGSLLVALLTGIFGSVLDRSSSTV